MTFSRRRRLLRMINRKSWLSLPNLTRRRDKLSVKLGIRSTKTLDPSIPPYCLEPPQGQDVLDGLEVKVAFGGVWKESLSELSGGQRSLVALSLILSLLLFKPAPLYILDEVDAD